MDEDGRVRSDRSFVSGRTLVLAVVGVAAAAMVTTLAVLRYGDADTGRVFALVGQPSVEFVAALVTGWAAVQLNSRFLRAVWLVIAVGMLGAALGDASWGYVEIARGLQIAYPGPAEFAYALEYLAFSGAMIAVVMSYRHRISLARPVTEALAVSSVLGVLVWFGIASPTLVAAGAHFDAATTTDIVYIAADVILIVGPATTLIATLIRAGDRLMLWPWTFFCAGALLVAVGDMAWFFQQAFGTYQPGSPVDFAWMVGHIVIAVAASLQLDGERLRELASE